MIFNELGLIAPILKALAEQGYEQPSPIQEKAIPPALAGRDVLGCAQTGTGKTCAFAAPILQRLNADVGKARPIRALILTPTRELALQIQESFVSYGKYLVLRSMVIFGGVGQAPQVAQLKRGVDILVATPGRLMDLQGQGFIDLTHLEIFVLDEADRMLDMGFIHDVRRILKLLPAQKQTLFFSATMPPEITSLVNSLLQNPVKVAVDPVSSPVEVIDQTLYLVDKGNKTKLLAKLIKELSVKNALIFTRTKHGANKVAADLEKAGITAAAIHGNKSQTARQQALADFKRGAVQALVATDIAARGLDIEELSHVFNYNLPEVSETYIHRIGRTGRAGRGGTAVSFCDFGEKAYLKDIEKLIGKKIPLIEDHPWPMEVFEVATKDPKGNLVNADDAEARNAAKERKAQRLAAEKQAKRTKAAPAERETGGQKRTAAQPKAERTGEAKARAPQPPRKKGRPLGTMGAPLPETSQRAAPPSYHDFVSRDPLADEVVMDATARLFASHPRAVQSPAYGQKPQREESGRGQGRAAQPPRKKPSQQEAKKVPLPAREGRNAAPARATAPAQNRDHSRGRRGRPPEVTLRSGNQKDSTEQPSLMKPYYLKHD